MISSLMPLQQALSFHQAAGLSRIGNRQRFTSARTLVKRPLDQVHQVLAFPAVGYHDKDIYAAYLTASILGGGMSSRLFQEARERRGLCYSTFAYVSAYADTA
jgi:predicted Zn-dependent peptidase